MTGTRRLFVRNVGWLLAALCAVVLVLGWGEVFSPSANTGIGVAVAPDGNDAVVTKVRPDSRAARAGVRVGDRVDLHALSLSDRHRVAIAGTPAGTSLSVPFIRGSQNRTVTLVAQSRPWQLTAFNISLLTIVTFTLLVAALLVLRRPSMATAAFVFYAVGAVTSSRVDAQFNWIPNPWFGAASVVILTVLSSLPAYALLPFIVRFPTVPLTRAARTRVRIADALFVVAAIVLTLQAVYEPIPYTTWVSFDIWSAIVPLFAALIFAILAYHDASGEDRRRIGWVIAGFVVSDIGYALYNVADTFILTPGFSLVWLLIVAQTLNLALPIALAYAVLRHRVLDIGFAVNRTVVYAALTGMVVAVVSIVDWLTGRLLSEQRLALAIEAVVTISFGFALNWLHGRTERLVDRIVFRARHLAEKRIEHRIEALGFAVSETAVDEALAVDAPAILDLSSAAVFGRSSESSPFALRAATGWPPSSIDFTDDTLLVRTLRALERSFFLDDLAIALDGVAAGKERPVLAIPISTQHDLIGFVLYGNRRDGASPDPEEISLLQSLARAAGAAYRAVEARQWRDRAAALETSSMQSALPAGH